MPRLNECIPRVRAKQVTDAVRIGLDGVAVPWIAAWREDVCKSADEQMKVPAFCKKDDASLRDLLGALRGIMLHCLAA